MSNAAKKKEDKEDLEPLDAESREADEDDEEDGEDEDEDDDTDDEDEDEDDEDDEESLAKDICQAIRDAQESCVSAVVERKKILLDLDDDSHWVLTLRRRD